MVNKPFFFVMNAEPTAAAPNTEDVKYALVHIWVMSSSREEAEIRARAYLMDYAWIVKEVEFECAPDSGQIAHLDIDEKSNYLKAAKSGLSADFLTVPKVDRPGEEIEIRPVYQPVNSKGKH
jgi:hypothetical protein